MASEKNVLQDHEHIVCFFSCITAMVEKDKAKGRRKRNDQKSSEEDEEKISNSNYGISLWIMFNWPEYGIWSIAEHIWRIFAGRV